MLQWYKKLCLKFWVLGVLKKLKGYFIKKVEKHWATGQKMCIMRSSITFNLHQILLR
jgi:hypothetical protein